MRLRNIRLRRRYGRQSWWEYRARPVEELLHAQRAKTIPVPRMTMQEMVAADRRDRTRQEGAKDR